MYFIVTCKNIRETRQGKLEKFDARVNAYLKWGFVGPFQCAVRAEETLVHVGAAVNTCEAHLLTLDDILEELRQQTPLNYDERSRCALYRRLAKYAAKKDLVTA